MRSFRAGLCNELRSYSHRAYRTDRIHCARNTVCLLVMVCNFNVSPVLASGVTSNTLAVIVNVSDPQSVAIAAYYQAKRKIPAANIIRVSMPRNAVSLSSDEFAKLKAEVERATPGNIQAYALTWLTPYRVECMSITTAFAVGFDRAFCSDGCKLTRSDPYFDSNSDAPAIDFGLRPTMSIAAVDLQHARDLIDRGVAADGTAPKGTAYLLSSGDAARNVRAARYDAAETILSDELKVQRINAESLSNANDVMFYFIGAKSVAQLTTNRFLPGAVADHLTSTGGDLLGTHQMSSLRWLEAGATGSYGTVLEPCNFATKFPDPAVLMKHYLAGDTLVEAYWKSVAMPGQGIFIGEPLAKPYGGAVLQHAAARSEPREDGRL